MNREIKFRAWDGKKMVIPNTFDFRVQTAYWKENSCIESSKIVMQYTGLKDKNGKEIYEGDIVCLDGLSKWYIDYTGRGFIGKPLKANHFINQNNLENNNYLQFELIGNIHENPQFLNPTY